MTNMPLTFPTCAKLFRPLLWLGLAGLLASVLAISASASDDPGLAAIGGEGAGHISGFIVSDIRYGLDADDPGRLATVSLTVVGEDGRTPPARVRVSVRAGQPAVSCFSPDGMRWTCPVAASVAEADALRVSASG